MSRYFRLMALAGTDMAFSLPLSLYFMVRFLLANEISPWVSWDDTHQYVHEVWVRSYETIVGVPGQLKLGLDLTRCEAVRQYKKIFWQAAAPFGFKPPAPSPEHQLTSWPRRLAARIVGSDGGGATSTVPHADLEAGQSIAEPAAFYDEKPDTMSSKGSSKAEINASGNL
ncbi:hypothetical protein FRC07_008001 [Ceratobasidium sp. 392]|nr:hypothetical protein FRC07_008001 [Ceratobasidium sp. 392]